MIVLTSNRVCVRGSHLQRNPPTLEAPTRGNAKDIKEAERQASRRFRTSSAQPKERAGAVPMESHSREPHSRVRGDGGSGGGTAATAHLPDPTFQIRQNMKAIGGSKLESPADLAVGHPRKGINYV